jgi:hypothetical protein
VPAPFNLTSEQRDAFDRRGVVSVPGFYAREAIDAMADRVWADIERRFGYRRDQPQTWRGKHPGHFQALKKSGAFSALRSPELVALADATLGAWIEPAQWGGLLLTFPTSAPTIARPPWHLDIGGAERLTPLPTLRIFTFLEPAPPGGGGTLYVAGSHRLAIEIERDLGRKVRSAEVRERLAAMHPWFAGLITAPYGPKLDAFLGDEAEVGGQPVRLEQMSGAPGDLILMHPAILHGGAHNALDRPRMMLTEWITRREQA